MDKFEQVLKEAQLNDKAQPKGKKTKPVTSTMPAELIEQIDQYAKATDKSRSEVIADFCQKWLNYLMENTKDHE